MAKKKTTNKQILNLRNVAASLGGEIVGDVPPIGYFIDSGNLAMNYIISGKFIPGGIPGGRITEFYGPSSSSKSLWGSALLRGVQKMGGVACLLDCENALNAEFAARAGHIDIDNLIRFGPAEVPTLERAFSKIYNLTKLIREKDKDVPILFVYDSITVSMCERELRELDLPDNFTEAQHKKIVKAKEQPGERAKVCAKEFRKLQSFLPKHNASVFVINQTRDKIGVLYGNPETTGGGGKSLEFYASCRMRTAAQKKMFEETTKRPLGVNIKIANKKNRENTPFMESENVKLYFDRGIDPLGGILTVLRMAGRITANSGGNFTVNPKYSNGEEVKFKSALSRNDIPVEVLLKCPAMIDADSADEVEEYLKDWREASNLMGEVDVVENDILSDEEELIKEIEGEEE